MKIIYATLHCFSAKGTLGVSLAVFGFSAKDLQL